MSSPHLQRKPAPKSDGSASVKRGTRQSADPRVRNARDSSSRATTRRSGGSVSVSSNRQKGSEISSLPGTVTTSRRTTKTPIVEPANKEPEHSGTEQADTSITRAQKGTTSLPKKPRDHDRSQLPFSDAAIESYAALLATVNTRSHARALLRDANSILEKIVFPMSFPWTHRIKPVVKSIPCDIDEMFGIRAAGNDVFDRCGFDKLEGVIDCERDGISESQFAAQRSQDPGVVELISTSPTTIAHLPAINALRSQRDIDIDPQTPGELSLLAYIESRAMEREAKIMKTSNHKATSVSCRAGSTSSQSSIFGYALDQGQSLLKMEAFLPSSDVKVNQAPGNVAGINGKGVSSCETSSTNRDHLVWSSLERGVGNGDSSSSRRVYRSLLTDKLLECSSHKRPRKMMVSVRLNGCILASSDPRALVNPTCGDSAIDDAIDAAISSSPLHGSENQQCSLDRKAFTEILFQDRFDRDNNDCLIRMQRPFTVSLSTKFKIPLPGVTVEPPQIDCMPCEDGQIVVTCTSRGRLYTSRPVNAFSPTASNPSESGDKCTALCAFLDVSAIDSNACSVCWSKAGPETVLGLSSLVKCKGCAVPVHRACYGKPILGRYWTCDTCMDCDTKDPPLVRDSAARQEHYTRHRWSIHCDACQLAGATLTRQPDGTYVHEVCRTWAPVESDDRSLCALCDREAGPVIRCMAENCQVMFHPMCALIASNASMWKRQNSKRPCDESPLQGALSDDEFHCTQFRLAKLEVGSSEWGDTVTVPVGFCGYHNPDRRPDFYGWYPRGRFLEKAMRIPPCIVSDDAQFDN